MADSNTAADIYGVPAEQPNLAITPGVLKLSATGRLVDVSGSPGAASGGTR